MTNAEILDHHKKTQHIVPALLNSQPERESCDHDAVLDADGTIVAFTEPGRLVEGVHSTNGSLSKGGPTHAEHYIASVPVPGGKAVKAATFK